MATVYSRVNFIPDFNSVICPGLLGDKKNHQAKERLLVLPIEIPLYIFWNSNKTRNQCISVLF